MTKEFEETEKKAFEFTPKHFAIIIPVVLVLSAGILAGAIYLFSDPGLVSGIVFGIIILVLFVIPLVLAIIFYFKKVKTPVQEAIEKKKIEILRVEE